MRSTDLKPSSSPYKQSPLLGIAEGVAVLGGVGGAVAVFLGADAVLLSLPIVMPAVTLILGRWKERRRVERLQQVEDEVKLRLSEQNELLLDSREGLMSINDSVVDCLDNRLKRLEEKNLAMEATALATGQNVRQIIGGLKSLPDVLRRVLELQQQNALYNTNLELKTSLDRWGRAQLEGLKSVDNKIRFLEDSTRRLEASVGGISAQNTTSFDYYGQQNVPITVDSEPIPAPGRARFFSQAKDLVINEISGVLQDLQSSQVDIAQTLQDLSFQKTDESTGQSRFGQLEGQMADLASQLISLPSQMTDGVRKELEALEAYKGDMALQLSSVQMSLQALERTILEIKDREASSDGKSQVIFPDVQPISKAEEAQVGEQQNDFSKLLDELAMLRTSFDDFKRKQTAVENKDALLNSPDSVEINYSDTTTEDLGEKEPIPLDTTTPSANANDAEEVPPPVSHTNPTATGEEPQIATGVAPESPVSQTIPFAMQFQEDEFEAAPPAFLDSPDISPSAPPMPRELSSYTGAEDYMQPVAPSFGEFIEYDSEPTWSTVVDPKEDNLSRYPYPQPRFDSDAAFGREEPMQYRNAFGNSDDSSSHAWGNSNQEDQMGGWEQTGQSQTPLQSDPRMSSYTADREILPSRTAAESASNEAEERFQESLDVVSERRVGGAVEGGSDAQSRLMEGLQLLKAGREAVSVDFGEAYRLLGDALDCFESYSRENPKDARSLGNGGNALLALGELKMKMADSLSEIQSGTRSRGSQAQMQLRQEAEQLFTLAGGKFKLLLDCNSSDVRGYMNWAKALNLRAKITDDPVKVEKLFRAAVVKYEQVLSLQPDSAPATFAYTTVLRDWARSRSPRDTEASQMMQQAVSCLKTLEKNSSSPKVREEAARRRQLCVQLFRSLGFT